MVVRTWEQALKATTLSKVIVATDDDRIAETCRAAGAEVVMTSDACPNGAMITRRLPGSALIAMLSATHCMQVMSCHMLYDIVNVGCPLHAA